LTPSANRHAAKRRARPSGQRVDCHQDEKDCLCRKRGPARYKAGDAAWVTVRAAELAGVKSRPARLGESEIPGICCVHHQHLA
jgi:hypothetical protein